MTKMPNRLINETSPYLLQHAYNPVDWYPWCAEAFEKAQKENRLIFLSIGYSTCHWCHKMAHDTFEDKETAQYLNDYYVSIKVDREERPDIDEIYMLACQILSESCGWPLNIVMTPEKKPIFAATYLSAKEDLRNRSLVSIFEEINKLWLSDRNKVFQIENLILNRLEDLQKEPVKEEINTIALEKAFDSFTKNFDKKYGGFGPSPKFPNPHHLSFLLSWYKKTGKKYALEMVEKTLNSMYQGGIFDHVGGGFHRYSTDSMWQIPHFEKMLYDQALIANVYLEAYQITRNELYAHVAKKTLNFVLNELTNDDGAFYSGIDADSEGKEGKFYVWSKYKIFTLLEPDANIFCDFYDVTKEGNLGEGQNVLYISDSIENISEKYKLSPDEIKVKLDICLKKLYEERNKRTYPHIDDKIICAWNGLMIKTFALAARIFNNDDYKIAAINASNFIIKHLLTSDGLFRSYRKGASDIKGFLEDYAFLSYGLLELYDLTSDEGFLKIVEELVDKMISEFYDSTNGGFFTTSINSETILMRIKSPNDNTIPSGNSIAALVLLKLAKITGNSDYTKLVDKTFNYFGYSVNQFPSGYAQLLSDYLYSNE